MILGPPAQGSSQLLCRQLKLGNSSARSNSADPPGPGLTWHALGPQGGGEEGISDQVQGFHKLRMEYTNKLVKSFKGWAEDCIVSEGNLS